MAGQNVLEFTTANWTAEVVQSDKPVVVDFWAPWCGPCRMLTPIIDRLAERFAGSAKVGKLNVDDHPEIATQYGVTSIPRILIFKGSAQPRQQMVGVVSENDLANAINSVMAS